ncbi:hypothetical protein H0H92_003248 [Tricholoma furcatifolium]|nr:hypothetical protein H0H92_003248 [Tricholoma furcatifolium]
MGVDGQNPNLKERFELRQVHNASMIDIRIWHLSQSKKKKKRNLVASASHSLAELIRQQEKNPRAELELRLHCQTASRRAVSSKGRPQNGATLLLKMHYPVNTKKNLLNLTNEQWEAGSSSSGAGSTKVSDYPSMPPSPTDDTWPDAGILPGLRRRRRRGYGVNSDDELYSTDGDDEDSKAPIFSDGGSFCGDEDDESTLRDEQGYLKEPHGIIRLPASRAAQWVQAIWPTVLPQYTERIEVPGDMSFVERILASFTTYSELKAARLDSQYEKVFTRLQLEWTYVGGLLVAIAAVCTAVFAIAPGSFFNVDSFARDAIAASSIASGLGIACDSWFLLRYTWADLHTFIHRARDVYSSYFFFALSARVPALCLFISALTLMIFMGLVAFESEPLELRHLGAQKPNIHTFEAYCSISPLPR